MSDDTSRTRPRVRARFSAGELGRILVVPVITVALFILLFRSRGTNAPAMAGDMERVTLSQKDRNFHVIPPARGGATGSVWYRPTGTAFSFELRATGLVPHRRYLLELSVDNAIYTVTSRAVDEHGELSLDTTLAEFAEGTCVGDNYDPPRPVRGAHDIKFWVKSDGNPASGTSAVRLARAAPGASLPCRGNGDGDYRYVLLENSVAHFVGR